MSEIPRFLYAQLKVASRDGDEVLLRPDGTEGAGIVSLVVDARAWASLGVDGAVAVTVAPAESPRFAASDPTVTSLRNALLTLVTAVRPLPDLPETAEAALSVAVDVLERP